LIKSSRQEIIAVPRNTWEKLSNQLLAMIPFKQRKTESSAGLWRQSSRDVNQRLLPVLGKITELLAPQSESPTRISSAEFKIFSQWGEDGIVHYLLRHVSVPNQIFVEFGVENYQEANTRWLVEGHNWSGLVLDGSQQHIDEIKADPIYWKHQLKAVCGFVDAENINTFISRNGISGDIGLLSVDIDGVDYWVWKAIDVVTPAMVIVEYNSLFGPTKSVTVPYDPGFARQKAHYSWSYYGASLAALVGLGKTKGYAFVGSNSAGNNAFFVKSDLLLSPLRELTAQQGYVKRTFREARDRDGRLMFPTFEEEAALIEGLPLVEVPV
jgi:hypothetical protein